MQLEKKRYGFEQKSAPYWKNLSFFQYGALFWRNIKSYQLKKTATEVSWCKKSPRKLTLSRYFFFFRFLFIS